MNKIINLIQMSLTNLIDLTGQLYECAKSDDLDNIILITDKRERLINIINDLINRMQAPVETQMSDLEIESKKSAIEKVHLTIESIREIDLKIEEILKERKNSTLASITKSYRIRKNLEGYANKG